MTSEAEKSRLWPAHVEMKARQTRADSRWTAFDEKLQAALDEYEAARAEMIELHGVDYDICHPRLTRFRDAADAIVAAVKS